MSYRADKQVIDTHTLADTQTGAMTIPEGQNWPRVKATGNPVFHQFTFEVMSFTIQMTFVGSEW